MTVEQLLPTILALLVAAGGWIFGIRERRANSFKTRTESRSIEAESLRETITSLRTYNEQLREDLNLERKEKESAQKIIEEYRTRLSGVYGTIRQQAEVIAENVKIVARLISEAAVYQANIAELARTLKESQERNRNAE